MLLEHGRLPPRMSLLATRILTFSERGKVVSSMQRGKFILITHAGIACILIIHYLQYDDMKM